MMGMVGFGLFGLVRRSKRLVVGLGAPTAGLDAHLGCPGSVSEADILLGNQQPLGDEALRTQISELMLRAQVEYSDIYVEKHSDVSRTLQASFSGQGPTRRIVLGDVLLKELTGAEILAAVAHEAGHVAQPKTPGRIGAALSIVLLLGLFEGLLRIASRRRWLGAQHRHDIRLLPLLLLAFFVVQTLAAPVAGALSRERELDADAFGLRVLNDRPSFVSMLVKLTRINKADPTPPSWAVWLGMSHPPMLDRLQRVSKAP